MKRLNLKVENIALIIAGLFLVSCSTVPHAPQFVAPSVEPIKQHAEAIELKIDAAASHAEKAKIAITDASKVALALKTTTDLDALTKHLIGSLKLADSEIDALKVELASAKTESAVLRGAADQLKTQIADETHRANDLGKAYDAAQTKIESLHRSNARWIKATLILAVVALGEGAWIFRKPLMLLAGV